MKFIELKNFDIFYAIYIRLALFKQIFIVITYFFNIRNH